MNAFYELYALIIGVWVFYDAPAFGRSRWWWGFGVLFLPFMTPLYFIKTRPVGGYWKCIGLWLLGFFIVHFIGTFWIKVYGATLHP